MTIQETIKMIDEPKGWLKITPSDIRNLNDYCKKLESENKQLILSGVVASLPVLERCGCCEPQEEPIKICTNCNGYIE